MKQEIKMKCECGKEIKGFSEIHLKKNLKIHKLISKEHYERMKLIRNVQGEIIYTSGLNTHSIVEMLANNPIMVEDIKEIGRLFKTSEEKYEEKIMVS